MESSSCYKIPSIIFVFFLFFVTLTSVYSEKVIKEDIAQKKTMPIKTQLNKINKPFVKSIQSPDGDIIDCVLFHHQPAFDLPQLRETISVDLPDVPSGIDNSEMTSEIEQLWNSNGESCPNGTIPIRRTSESDILRFAEFGNTKMGGKFAAGSTNGHEYAIGFVGGEYYGGQAKFNVWAPNVANSREFSVSQMWVATIDIPDHETNSIEAGWMVDRDTSPRIFIYYTNLGYKHGCLNLLCPGFVQTTNRLSFGAAIKPVSTYDGDQFDYSILIWKDKKSGDWWLRMGKIIMGYWPANIFPDLQYKANTVQFGGEVYDTRETGQHTSTQMGSGHFPNEGFKKASFIKNMGVVDGENNLTPLSDISISAEHPNCYDVSKGHSDNWGTYIYFGGPGNNPNCQ